MTTIRIGCLFLSATVAAYALITHAHSCTYHRETIAHAFALGDICE